MTDPKTAAGNEPAKNQTPNVQSTKAVDGAVTQKPDPDNDTTAAAKKKEAEDAAIAKEVEAQAEISAAEEKKLEGILDNNEAEAEAERPIREFSDEELDKARIPGAMKKILKLVSSIPKETPDEHVIWGAAGQKLLLGDLRELCKYVS